VLRARPRGMLLGAFFDVPKPHGGRRSVYRPGPSTPAHRQSTPSLLGVTTVVAPAASPRRRGWLTRHGVGVTSKRRQKPRKDRAVLIGNEEQRHRPSIRTMPRRCRPRNEPIRFASAMTRPVRSQRGRTPRGPGLRVTGVPRMEGRVLRGVVTSRGSRVASARPGETWRTPRSAAGCNKPASRSAEKAGEVVRYHEVGTRLPDGIRGPMMTDLGLLSGVDARRSFERR
jgi:hypothetical protein